MPTDAKIKLSKARLQFMQSEKVILTKIHVIETVCNVFGGQLPLLKQLTNKYGDSLPLEAIKSFPKISKGENYHKLPYVMLDYPAYFSKEKIFAVRTFFWWGNYVSVTLHLSGKFKEQYAEALIKNALKTNMPFYISISENEWRHDFAKTEYRKLKKVDWPQVIANKPFCKLALRFKLRHWNNMGSLLGHAYAEIFHLFHNGG